MGGGVLHPTPPHPLPSSPCPLLQPTRRPLLAAPSRLPAAIPYRRIALYRLVVPLPQEDDTVVVSCPPGSLHLCFNRVRPGEPMPPEEEGDQGDAAAADGQVAVAEAANGISTAGAA